MSKAIGDALKVFGGNSFSFVLAFVTSVITARYLGPAGKGLLSSIIFIPTLIITFGELGVRQSIVFHLGRKIFPDKELISTAYVLITFLAIPIIIIAFVIYNTYYKGFFSLSSQVLAILVVPITLWTKVTSGVLLGQGRISVFNRISWLPAVINLLGVLVLVVWTHMGINGALLSSAFASFLICVYGFRLTTANNNFSFSYVDFKIAVRLLSKGFLFALSLFVVQLNYKLDIIILKKLVDISEIGIYSLGVNLAEILWQIPTAMGIVILSRTATKSEDKNQKYKVAQALRVSTVIMIVISLIMVIITPYIIPLMYGDAYLGSVSVTRTLLLGVIVFTFYKILNSRLAGLGKPLITIMLFIPCLILKIACNFILVPKMGIDGAAWSSNISYMLGGILVVLAFSKIDNISLKEIFHFTRKDWSFLSDFLYKLKAKFK